MKRKSKIKFFFDFATLITAFFSIGFICFQLMFPQRTAGAVREALISSATNVIPSLFPFMVISRFIIALGMLSPIENTLGKGMSKLLGIPQKSVSSLLIGILSGFPIGAVTVCESYKKGEMTKDEAEFALCVSHNTGPAFPVGVVGVLLWNNKNFGVFIYFSQILAMLFLCLLKRKDRRGLYIRNTVPKYKAKKITASAALTSSVTSSASSCVGIVGFIVIFKVITEMILSFIPIKFELIRTMISAVAEFSSGSASAAELGGAAGAAFSGFAVGFGGISALMQACALTAETDLSIKKCALFKSIQGAVCAVMCTAYYNMFIKEDHVMEVYKKLETIQVNNFKYIAVLLVCAAAVIKYLGKKHKNTIQYTFFSL